MSASLPQVANGFSGIRAVLFDLDGTLVHSRIDFDRMRREVLALIGAHGLALEPYRHLDVLTMLSTAASALADATPLLAHAEAALTAIELEACAGATEGEGAIATLQWLLDEGMRVGIVTRNCRPAVEQMLSRFPLPHEVLLTRTDTPRVKPDPLHLHLALEQLGVPAPEAVMVGDHRMDVEGGKAAGMRTLGLLAPGHPPDYFAEAAPDGVIRALPELRAWLR